MYLAKPAEDIRKNSIRVQIGPTARPGNVPVWNKKLVERLQKTTPISLLIKERNEKGLPNNLMGVFGENSQSVRAGLVSSINPADVFARAHKEELSRASRARFATDGRMRASSTSTSVMLCC